MEFYVNITSIAIVSHIDSFYRSGKGYRVLAYHYQGRRISRHPFCIQKNRRTGFPIRRQNVYLPDRSWSRFLSGSGSPIASIATTCSNSSIFKPRLMARL